MNKTFGDDFQLHQLGDKLPLKLGECHELQGHQETEKIGGTPS
jgi:hypothetical protein